MVGFGLYIGDIEEIDSDLLFVLSLVNDTGASLVDERIDIVSSLRFSLEISERGDDCFFVSELFKRFNGLWCSCGLVILNNFVLLFIESSNVEDSFNFLGLICDAFGKLLISYKDKLTLSNLSAQWNFVSSGGIGRNSLTGFSGRGTFIFNGGTRNGGCGRAFPIS